MAQSLLLPAGVLLIGIAAVLGFALPRHLARGREPDARGRGDRLSTPSAGGRTGQPGSARRAGPART